MRHTEDSAEILSKANSLKKYIPSVRYHHECYNNNGYPDGLKGEQIPLVASIISVADAFDLMIQARPYRKALSEEEALAKMAHLSGKQFNPRLVEIFIQVMHEQKQTAWRYETK